MEIGNLKYSTSDYNKTYQLTQADIDKEENKDKKALLQHLFNNQEYLNGKDDNVLSGNEIVNFLSHIDKDEEGEIDESKLKEWIERNGHTEEKIGTFSNLASTIKSIFDDIAKGVGKFATSVYQKFEEKTSGFLQNLTIESYKDAGIKGSKDLKYNEPGDTILERMGQFKFTEEGYMDLGESEKPKAYKAALLELANGELDKYDKVKKEDHGKTGLTRGLDIEEFMAEQKEMYINTYGELDKMVGADSSSFPPSFENYVKNLFALLDSKDDGILDEFELAASYAYLDLGYSFDDSGKVKNDEETGRQAIGLDGKIVFGESIPADANGNIIGADDARAQLKNLLDFLAGI